MVHDGQRTNKGMVSPTSPYVVTIEALSWLDDFHSARAAAQHGMSVKTVTTRPGWQHRGFLKANAKPYLLDALVSEVKETTRVPFDRNQTAVAAITPDESDACAAEPTPANSRPRELVSLVLLPVKPENVSFVAAGRLIFDSNSMKTLLSAPGYGFICHVEILRNDGALTSKALASPTPGL